jgi:hypothetical protein
MANEVVHANRKSTTVPNPFNMTEIDRAMDFLRSLGASSPHTRTTFVKQPTIAEEHQHRMSKLGRWIPPQEPVIVRSQVAFAEPITTTRTRANSPAACTPSPNYLLTRPPASFGPIRPQALPLSSIPGATPAVIRTLQPDARDQAGGPL